MCPLDIFLKCILLVILLFRGIISNVSEDAGCSDQRSVRYIKLNFGLMVSFEIQLIQFKPTPEELLASTLKMPGVQIHYIFISNGSEITPALGYCKEIGEKLMISRKLCGKYSPIMMENYSYRGETKQ